MEKQIEQSKVGLLLQRNAFYKISEILIVFLSAFALIQLLQPYVAHNPVMYQSVIWAANILMLVMVWTGIKIRGESWKDFGLTFRPISVKDSMKVIGLSIVVFVLATAGFVIGSIVMANITGIPEDADMSKYDFLRDNIGMLMLTLGGVYIVSSFGEEVIYRAFLINRITQLGLDTKSGKIVAVLLSSAVFGFVHYDWGPMGMAQTGFMGLVLGICYLKLKKRLWILIIAHAYMDTILMVQMYLASNQPI